MIQQYIWGVKKIDEEIIRKFTLSLNNDLLGYDHLAFAGINVRAGFTDSITKEGEFLHIQSE